MRTAFQMLVFLAYLAALGWGGWYVFSGQMIADRNVRNAPVLEENLADAAPSEDVVEGGTPPEETFSEDNT